jgi:DNA-binding transcriptional regulator YiaG
MSTKLSFKEAFARPAEASAGQAYTVSGDRARTLKYALEVKEISQPVSVAMALRALGLSLRKAHETLERLAAGQRVVVRLNAELTTVGERLGPLGVDATPVVIPDLSAKEIRESLGYSQVEFADRFGLELTTLQNWEQGRNALDGPARILLAIIGQFPEVVDSVLGASLAEQAGPYSEPTRPR